MVIISSSSDFLWGLFKAFPPDLKQRTFSLLLLVPHTRQKGTTRKRDVGECVTKMIISKITREI